VTTSSTDDLRAATAGIWRDNLALVQLLGLCPLLAITTSLVNGLALGLATLLVVVLTSIVISLLRGVLLPTIRIPLFVLLVAAVVTCVDLLTNAVLDELHEALGLFLPLIVTNCGLVAQAETVASRRPVWFALLSAISTGLGFLAVLTLLGALRELMGSGTLFAGIETLAGVGSSWLTIDVPIRGALVAILPPGAFFGMALLLALRNRVKAPSATAASTVATADPSR
jgi:electron transport complex protein RnfE